MDPISLSASIAGLVGLADLVFRYSTKYTKGVKGARKEIEDLTRELRNLSVVLHNLSLVAFDLEESTQEGRPASLTAYHLHDCRQLLRKLETELNISKAKIGSDSRLERIKERFTWPFSSQETKTIMQDVQSHKRVIEFALSADSLSKLNLLLSRQSDTKNKLSIVQDTVDKILDIQVKISLDTKRQEVLKAFTQASARAEFETNRRLRHHLTGLWLTKGEDFEQWYTDPGSRIWCSGIPGAGKSVIAAALIEECLQRNESNPGAALAYCFCTYRDEKTHDASSILSGLCAQLSQQDENAFKVLEEYHDDLRSPGHHSKKASADNLVKVLRQMCRSFSSVYIIIDGLDECGNQVEETVDSLANLNPFNDDNNISLALLGRDEISIRQILESRFVNIEIEAHTEDVQLYVSSELEQRIAARKLRLRNLDLKDEIMTKLVEGAKGMFRWVACQLDHICELPTDGARRKALDHLPPTLFATYERILTRVNNSNEQVRQLVKRTLLLIASPHKYGLDFPAMCAAVSLTEDSNELFEDDMVRDEEILRHCGSLIRIKESYGSTCIEFAHYSVQEYLEDECLKHPALKDYGVSSKKVSDVLGLLCLRFITLKNYETPLEITEAGISKAIKNRQRPFYIYAATSWFRYIDGNAIGEGESVDIIDHLFQFSKAPCFCWWAVEITLAVRHTGSHEGLIQLDNRIMKRAILDILAPEFTPLHMAAAMGMSKVCRLLIDQGLPMDMYSKFGTPLHCAIAGFAVFNPTHYVAAPIRFYWFLSSEGQRQERRQIAQLLIESGARVESRFMPEEGEPISSLALALIRNGNFEMAADLVKSGLSVEEDDVEHFISCYSSGYYKFGHDKEKALTDFLQALKGTDAATSPRARLFSETLKFMQQVDLGTPDASSATQGMDVLGYDKIWRIDDHRRRGERSSVVRLMSEVTGGSAAPNPEALGRLKLSILALNAEDSSHLWQFICETLSMPIASLSHSVVIEIFGLFIQCGVASKYEEITKQSAMLPFVSDWVAEVPQMYEAMRNGELPTYSSKFNWSWFSHTAQTIANEGDCWASTTHTVEMPRLLSLATWHNDEALISLLIKNGVDVHSRVDKLSPFDFACFPNAGVREKTFEVLLSHASVDEISRGCEALDGAGPLHFAAGWCRFEQCSSTRVRQLLRAGVDVNSPISDEVGSPLAYHIHQNATETAQLLLEAGADPWARGSYRFDAALEAVRLGNVHVLRIILAMQSKENKGGFWDRTWTTEIRGESFKGGNALHLAAKQKSGGCLGFYLDNNLLSDLEAHDEHAETPMYYAARFGNDSAIRLLEARGGNINAKNSKGWSPLHIAAYEGLLETVKTLITLGAKQQVSHNGYTPLDCVFMSRHSGRWDVRPNIAEHLMHNFKPSVDFPVATSSPKMLKAIANALKAAIDQGDYQMCEKIFEIGCPADVELDNVYQTPLIMAICQNDVEIVKLLLDRGATVLFTVLLEGLWHTTLCLAIARPGLNGFLPIFLAKALAEGSDLLRDCDPLLTAISRRNFEGVQILLSFIKQRLSHPQSNLATLVNQPGTRSPHPAALHIAARANAVDACALLVENGANINGTDDNMGTPLHVAVNYGLFQAAEWLLNHGARPELLNIWSQTPLMRACMNRNWNLVELLVSTSHHGTGIDYRGRHVLHQMTDNEEDGDVPSVHFFSHFLNQGVDIHQTDHCGRATIHWMIASPEGVYLRTLLHRDYRLIQFNRVTRWPEDVVGEAFRLTTVAKNLRLVRPFISKHEMNRLCDLVEPGSHSLLCRAACYGQVDVIRSFIVAGVDDMEHECINHGTPLKAAILHQRIDAIKFLVHNGAKVPYDWGQPKATDISMANPDFVIRRWLFVGRYLERRMISDQATNSKEVSCWSGIRVVEVPMRWEWKKRRDETILEYASISQTIRGELRGQVVNVIGWANEGAISVSL